VRSAAAVRSTAAFAALTGGDCGSAEPSTPLEPDVEAPG
jgi:hypothetical protein